MLSTMGPVWLFGPVAISCQLMFGRQFLFSWRCQGVYVPPVLPTEAYKDAEAWSKHRFFSSAVAQMALLSWTPGGPLRAARLSGRKWSNSRRRRSESSEAESHGILGSETSWEWEAPGRIWLCFFFDVTLMDPDGPGRNSSNSQCLNDLAWFLLAPWFHCDST